MKCAQLECWNTPFEDNHIPAIKRTFTEVNINLLGAQLADSLIVQGSAGRLAAAAA